MSGCRAESVKQKTFSLIEPVRVGVPLAVTTFFTKNIKHDPQFFSPFQISKQDYTTELS